MEIYAYCSSQGKFIRSNHLNTEPGGFKIGADSVGYPMAVKRAEDWFIHLSESDKRTASNRVSMEMMINPLGFPVEEVRFENL
jgi:hypothetical protein